MHVSSLQCCFAKEEEEKDLQAIQILHCLLLLLFVYIHWGYWNKDAFLLLYEWKGRREAGREEEGWEGGRGEGGRQKEGQKKASAKCMMMGAVWEQLFLVCLLADKAGCVPMLPHQTDAWASVMTAWKRLSSSHSSFFSFFSSLTIHFYFKGNLWWCLYFA